MAEADDRIDLARVRRLAQSKCEGELTEEEVEELSDLLATSARACDEYWQIVTIHAQLQWMLDGKDDASHPTKSPGITLSERGSVDYGSRTTPAMWLTGLAACLFVAATGALIAWRFPVGQQPLAMKDGTASNAVLGTLTALVPKSNWSVG